MPAHRDGPLAVLKDRVPDRIDGFECDPLLHLVVAGKDDQEPVRFGAGDLGNRVSGRVVDRVGTHASDAQPVEDLGDIAAGGGAGNDARWIDLRTPIRHA